MYLDFLGRQIEISKSISYNSLYKLEELEKKIEKIKESFDTDIDIRHKKFPCIFLKLDKNNKLILDCKICKLTIISHNVIIQGQKQTYKCEIINDENNFIYTKYIKSNNIIYTLYKTKGITLEYINGNESYLTINKNIYFSYEYYSYVNVKTNVVEYIIPYSFSGLSFYYQSTLYGLENNGIIYMCTININKNIYSEEDKKKMGLTLLCLNTDMIKIEKENIKEDIGVFYKYRVNSREMFYDVININNDIIDNIYIKLNYFNDIYNTIIYKRNENKLDIIKNILNKKYINNFELSDIYCYFNKKIYILNSETENDNVNDAKVQYIFEVPNIKESMINIYNNKFIKIKTKYMLKPISGIEKLYKDEVKLNVLKLFFKKNIYSNESKSEYFKMEESGEYNVKYKINDIIYLIDLRKIDNKDIEFYKDLSKELIKNMEDIVYGYVYLDQNNEVILYIYNSDKYVKILNDKNIEDTNNEIYISNILKKYFNNITDIKKLKDIGIEGFIYNITLNNNINNNIIVKIPQNEKNKNKLLCEYMIGLKTINKIRQKIPTFMFTYGSVECPINDNIKIDDKNYKLKCDIKDNNRLYIFDEYINGKTLKELFENNLMNFEDFLIIYTQVLLSLELAQTEHSFTHYDLHRKNVMVKDVENYTYKIIIENSVYEFKNINKLPVIIDFGNSSSIINDKTIGKYSKIDKFIFPFLLNGVDMYKLLLWSVHSAKNSLKKDIKKLFKFYYDNGVDIYDIYNNSDSNIRDAINTYGSKIFLNDKIIQLTPLDFFNWLKNDEKYSNIINKYVNIYDKNFYISDEQIVLKTHKNIHNLTNDIVSNHITKNFIEYIYETNNNIYNVMKIDKLINNNSKDDNLNNYKNIIIPSNDIIIYMFTEILNLKFMLELDKNIENLDEINNMILNDKNKKLELINKFKLIFSFYNNIKLYLDIYLLLKQLKLDSNLKYINFVENFPKSIQYKTYFLYKDDISKVLRWCETIEKSLSIIKYITYIDKNEMIYKLYTYKNKTIYEEEQNLYINEINNIQISNCLLNNICDNIENNKDIIKTTNNLIYHDIYSEFQNFINKDDQYISFINKIKKIINSIT